MQCISSMLAQHVMAQAYRWACSPKYGMLPGTHGTAWDGMGAPLSPLERPSLACTSL